jgi:S-adenosylmethionine:tRNA ribosyltransferase-isomerase
LYAVRSAETRAQASYPAGRIEVLLTQQVAPQVWSALVRPGRKVRVGDRLGFPGPEGVPVLSAEVIDAGEFGERTLRFAPDPGFYQHLDRIGHMPLPPYIHREKDAPDAGEDRERYQTVYAEERGSAAAPTAGLHFTPEILAQLEARGVEIARITLHVGLGTFQPVRVATLDEIRLHTEHYTLSAAAVDALNRAVADRRRIVAVGTTTTRTLEHCAAVAAGRPLAPHSGATSIFIRPGHRFRLISGLLTNFHLPQSTLLMLVSAFLAPVGFPDPDPDPGAAPEQGRRAALAAYAHAIEQRYRFFSYGDCMLML